MSKAAAKPVGAQAIKKVAALWLERRMREDWSAADQAAFDDWLVQSPAHKLAYWRLDAAWNRTGRLAALRSHGLDEDTATEPKRISPLLLRIAAVLAIAAVIGIAATNFLMRPRERTFSTPVGGHEVVTFADGSRIELNTDTVLRARMSTERRMVWLDKGEAFFQVKHDSRHPFTVMAGDHSITDLGTKFVVRRDPGRLQVSLLEGSVRFGDADGKTHAKSTLLKPGDAATATTSSMFVTHATPASIRNELGWRRGVLVFHYTPLIEAAAEFNRYNRQKLVIADPAAARLTIYGTFPVNDVTAFARVARNALGLHVENYGDQILIQR